MSSEDQNDPKRDMDAALTQLRAEGYSARDEDVARLSPLTHEHINMQEQTIRIADLC